MVAHIAEAHPGSGCRHRQEHALLPARRADFGDRHQRAHVGPGRRTSAIAGTGGGLAADGQSASGVPGRQFRRRRRHVRFLLGAHSGAGLAGTGPRGAPQWRYLAAGTCPHQPPSAGYAHGPAQPGGGADDGSQHQPPDRGECAARRTEDRLGGESAGRAGQADSRPAGR